MKPRPRFCAVTIGQPSRWIDPPTTTGGKSPGTRSASGRHRGTGTMRAGPPLPPMRFCPSKMLRRLLGTAILVSLGFGASGCVNVSRKVIQGTGHGADWAVVPEGADYE